MQHVPVNRSSAASAARPRRVARLAVGGIAAATLSAGLTPAASAQTPTVTGAVGLVHVGVPAGGFTVLDGVGLTPSGLTVSAGPDLKVYDPRRDERGRVVVSVEAGPNVATGPRDVVVRFDNGATQTFPGALTVRTTEGQFQPVNPQRILDTRQGLGAPSRPVGNGETLRVKVAGEAGLPESGVRAVVLNVTATEPTADGYLTVFPAGAARPTASSVNFRQGQSVPNLVTAAVGTNGEVAVFNFAGETHVLFDIVGWYGDATAPIGARFVPVEPRRLFDSRQGSGPLGPNASIALPIGSRANGEVAVALNVTAVSPTEAGYLTVWPDGQDRPNTSSVNFVAGQVVPNMVIVPLGTDGRIRVGNFAGNVHVVVDLLGVFGDGFSTIGGGVLTGLTPARLLDTRTGLGADAAAPLGSEAVANVRVAGYGGVPATGAVAVVLNVTVVDPRSAGYLTVYSGSERPTASNLNFVAGQTVPNMVAVPLAADGTVNVFHFGQQAHVVVDVVGYYR